MTWVGLVLLHAVWVLASVLSGSSVLELVIEFTLFSVFRLLEDNLAQVSNAQFFHVFKIDLIHVVDSGCVVSGGIHVQLGLLLVSTELVRLVLLWQTSDLVSLLKVVTVCYTPAY